MSKIIRCAIYDRVSTDIQVQQGLSLDTQKELLTEYAKEHGYEIIDYYIDEGLTARKKLQNRRDFIRLLNDIKADKIDLVLVTKLDRWFRNVKDYHNVQAILEEHHCNWKTVLEDYDTTTADGQLKINIMLAVAQNESDRTSERIKVVFEHKKRNQEHLNGPIPFGYKNIDKHLQKDEDRRAIVEDIFRYYFTCFSIRSTIFYASNTYKDQAPTKYQIERMLKSEVYAGMRYGRSGYCEPYITPEEHARILNTCQAKVYPATNEPYLFGFMTTMPVLAAVSAAAFLVSRVRHIDFTAEEWTGAVLGSLLVITVMLSLLIPIELKFGTERSRVAMMVVFGGSFVVICAAVKVFEYLGIDWKIWVNRFDGLNLSVILTAFIMACGIIMAVSYLFSLRFMTKREF